MSLLERFGAWADRAIRTRMYQQAGAKAYVLSAYADAEGSGEGQVFDRALSRASDPELARMIRKHQDDELRHERMFEDRRKALGLPRMVVPAHLKTVDRLSAEAGGILDQPMDNDGAVAQAYALLYLVEERAYSEFGLAQAAFAETGDPQTAAMLGEIARDEERHLRYCLAVGRRYAGSAAAFRARVEALRPLEGRVYAAQSRGTVEHLLARGDLVLPRWMRLWLRPTMALAKAAGLGALPVAPPAWVAAEA
jgi:rubrerythrin